MIAGDDDGPRPRDALERLVVQAEPQSQGRQNDRLRDVVPGLRGDAPSSDRAVRVPRRLDYAAVPVRAIALPVKSLGLAKTRLSKVLTPLERGALSLAMYEDVLDATLALDGWDTWVVSPDESVLEIAVGRGAVPLREERASLRTAVHQIEAEAAARMAEALAVLLADTPFVTAPALTAVLHTLGSVVLAPSSDERGTNLLLRRPPGAIPSRFGPDSFRRHMETAAERDLPTAVVEREELGFDLDEPGDILTVLQARRPGRTLDVCRDMDLAARLSART